MPRLRKSADKCSRSTDPTSTWLNITPKSTRSSIPNTNKSIICESGLSFDMPDVNPEFNSTEKNAIEDSEGASFYDLSEFDYDIEQDPLLVNPGPSSTTFDSELTCNTSVKSIENSTVEEETNSNHLLSVLDDFTTSEFSLIDTKLEQNKNNLSSIKNMLSEYRNLLNDVESSMTQNKTDDNSKNIDSQQKTCPICHEVLGGSIATVTTICGHIFCLSCIEQVDKTTKKCPTCQKPITKKSKYVRIYL